MKKLTKLYEKIHLTFIINCLLLSVATPVVSSFAQDRMYGKPWAGRSEVMAQNGMVCTSHPLSTQAAIEILRAGGSAVDAAIAANAMEGMVEPHVNGIGGDIFAIVWDAKTQKLYGLNGSGRSPYSLTLEEFKKRGLTHIPALGPLPISVPGCVDGWFELHKKFGKLPMEKILSHAIGYGRNGFPVHDELAMSLQNVPRLIWQVSKHQRTLLPEWRSAKKRRYFQESKFGKYARKNCQRRS
ncbi:MAG: gamma-glutamyltransferase [Emticicia sp.]|nr:gamma-glutamyltransferase [Emticicia sp.]